MATRVERVGRVSGRGCPARDTLTRSPVISFYSTIMIQPGETARLVCDLLEVTIQCLLCSSYLFLYQPNDGGERILQWRRSSDDKELKTGGRYQLKGTDLLVHNVDMDDMGVYTCSAWNHFGVDMVVTSLCPLSPGYDEVYATC